MLSAGKAKSGTRRSKARNWILIWVVLIFIIGIRAATSHPIESTPYFDRVLPLVIAHQGGSGLRPGNTLLAFRHASDLGVDVLEMDVRITRDGVPVLIHDATLDRTTNASGPVADLDLAEIQRLDAAYHWPHVGEERPYRGRGVTVPTLDDVVERFPGMRLNIDIKAQDVEAAATVCGLLKDLNAQQRVLVASFSADVIHAFREACPRVATSAGDMEVALFLLHQKLRLTRLYTPTAHALQLPPKDYGLALTKPELFAAARERGMHVDLWTVNDRESMARLIADGVGGIITDYPDVMLDVLGETR